MSQKVKITGVKHVDVRLERANSNEALICASPRKIFTSVNMLPSEAKPILQGELL